MSAPAKKLSDLGKRWSAAPGWKEALPRIVTGATLAPRGEPDNQPIEKPTDLGAEFRRQYEIWRRDHPARAGDLIDDLPAIEDARFDLMRGARVVLVVGGAAIAAFYVVAVLPNLDSAGLQSAPPEPVPVKLAAAKTARLDVPPMPVAAPPALPRWPAADATDIGKPDATPLERAAVPAAPTPRSIPLSAEEIELLRKRGEDFIATGDLAAARLVLERAARARDARSAFALASTYDPAVLEQLHVYGATGDIELAVMWYERAEDYGSTDARPRLLALARKM
jgi:hypothetical protein